MREVKIGSGIMHSFEQSLRVFTCPMTRKDPSVLESCVAVYRCCALLFKQIWGFKISNDLLFERINSRNEANLFFFKML